MISFWGTHIILRYKAISNIQPLCINGHAHSFDQNLKIIKENGKKQMETCTKCSIRWHSCHEKYQNCNMKLKKGVLENGYHVWLSLTFNQMTKSMTISISYLVIIFPNSAHMCILTWQSKSQKEFPTFFIKRWFSIWLVPNKRFFMKELPKYRQKIHHCSFHTR